MRFARDAFLFVIPLLVLASIALLLQWWVLSLILLLLAGFVLFFFRDPERTIPADSDAIVSPADGKVIRVDPLESGTRISIFLSVFNVHVNRAPVAGRIERCIHKPGRFLPAFDDRASVENEQLIFQIGEISFALIAGIVARRIIPWRKVGDRVEKGDRIALIRFGSRADLVIPDGAQLNVTAGDRVRAGTTVLARWSQAK